MVLKAFDSFLIRFHLNGQKIKLKMKQKKLIGPCQLTSLKVFIDFKERSESIRNIWYLKDRGLDLCDHMEVTISESCKLIHAGRSRTYEIMRN